MRVKVTRFKSPEICLKELEPFIRNGQHLQTGKPFSRFGGLRSREILGNWLLCAVLNTERESATLTFTTDPGGSDGILYDTATSMAWPTEHVMVPRAVPGEKRDIQALIRDAVAAKQSKGGAPYASGKTLVIFLEAGLGTWFPNRAARMVPTVDFDGIWVCGLHGHVTGEYVYGVTQLDVTSGNAPIWHVRINELFDGWTVTRQQ